MLQEKWAQGHSQPKPAPKGDAVVVVQEQQGPFQPPPSPYPMGDAANRIDAEVTHATHQDGKPVESQAEPAPSAPQAASGDQAAIV